MCIIVAMSYYCSALFALFRVFHVVPYFSSFRCSAVPLFRVLVTTSQSQANTKTRNSGTTERRNELNNGTVFRVRNDGIAEQFLPRFCLFQLVGWLY